MDNTGDDQNLSRKERRARKREEKMARRHEEVKQEQQTATTQNMLTWGLVSLLGVALILFVVGLVGNGGNITQPDTVDITLAEDEWVAGNPDAEVTLVEYGDLQCPACRSAHGMLQPLLAEYGDSFRLVFRHFPLPMHQNAEEAAQAAEAAGQQDAFFPMHDLLFENQPEWADVNDPYDTFEEYATELELDLTQFEEDYNSEEAQEAVAEDSALGNEHAVTSTPTFFLNGERLSEMGFSEIQSEVISAIEEASSEDATSEESDDENEANGEVGSEPDTETAQ